MNRHERRKAAAKERRSKIVNFPDDTAPHEGAYLARAEVLWLFGVEALNHLEALASYTVMLAKPLPPQCCVCERDLGLRPGYFPSWVGKLSRFAVANSAADPRRYRAALANPPEAEKPGTVCMVGICETCCPADADPNPIFCSRFIADQEKHGGWLVNDRAVARFSTQSGSA